MTANNIILKDKDVLAVDKDNKIYKNNELWNISYTTPENWVNIGGDMKTPEGVTNSSIMVKNRTCKKFNKFKLF